MNKFCQFYPVPDTKPGMFYRYKVAMVARRWEGDQSLCTQVDDDDDLRDLLEKGVMITYGVYGRMRFSEPSLGVSHEVDVWVADFGSFEKAVEMVGRLGGDKREGN